MHQNLCVTKSFNLFNF